MWKGRRAPDSGPPAAWLLEDNRSQGWGVSLDVGAVDSGNARVPLEAREHHLLRNSLGSDREASWPLLTDLTCSL